MIYIITILIKPNNEQQALKPLKVNKPTSNQCFNKIYFIKSIQINDFLCILDSTSRAQAPSQQLQYTSTDDCDASNWKHGKSKKQKSFFSRNLFS